MLHEKSSEYTLISVPVWSSILAFNVCWLLSVVFYTLAPVILLTYLLFHCFLLFLYEDRPKQKVGQELLWAFVLLVIAFFVEQIIFTLGIIFSTNEAVSVFNVPIWLLCIWGLFALNFRYGLVMIRRFRWYGVALVGGLISFSYLAGASLNPTVALQQREYLSAVFIGGYWSILLPVLVSVYNNIFANE